jgi:hypothetical protein
MEHAEPRVNWFLTSTRPEARRSRTTVNRWYAAFPDPDGALGRRLRSPDDVDHQQAMDELHVHHLLRRSSRCVTYEEEGRGPDFRVYEAGQLLASVEVASLFTKAEWAAEDQRHNQLADELNRRLDLSCGYFVDFEINNLIGTGDPPPAKLARWIRAQILQLPDPRTRDGRRAGTPQEQLTRIYASGAVCVTVHFWPLKPEQIPDPGSTDRVVALGRISGGWVTDDERLRDRITEKAGSKYEQRSRREPVGLLHMSVTGRP